MSSIIDKKKVFPVVFYIILLSWISIKVVLPALPKLNTDLGTSNSAIQLSVTCFLLFFSLSRLIWGPMAEIHGVIKTLKIGVIISIAGSVLSMLAVDFPMYFAGRSLEGIGMGSIPITGMSILTNLYDRKNLAKKLSYVNSVSAAMPAIAPVFGGYIIQFFGWRAIFGLLLLMSLLVLVFIYRYLNKIDFRDKYKTVSIYLGVAVIVSFGGFLVLIPRSSGKILK